jgi:hypothetical protein
MKNKTKRKIIELEQEIEKLKCSDECECSYIQVLENRIREYKKEEIIETEYNPDLNFDEHFNTYKFLYEKERELYNPYSGNYKAVVKYYECKICGKPFCFEDSIGYA